jgi:hypothetical protein
MRKKVLFIHRSVGSLLIHNGYVYELLKPYESSISFSDYNHNLGNLTSFKGQKHLGYVFPGENTNPENLAKLFSEPNEETQKILDWIAGYDVVVLKSCYPNSDIKSDDELGKIKDYYKHIFKYFTNSKQQLGILTSPPLRPLVTKPDRAKRARELANWLASTSFGSGIKVLNFFDLLAEPEIDKHANTLRKEYRHKMAFYDSHPNKLANKTIGPKFVEFISSF